MYTLLSEALGYGLASAVALGVDLAILEGLVRLGWHYLAASALAFVAGGVVAYLLSTRFVFRFRRIGEAPLELGYFIALGMAGLLINSAVIFVAVDWVGLGIAPAKLAASTCTFATNFALRRRVLFTPVGNC